MNSDKISSEDRSDFRMYHQLQYERITQLEQQRLTMTNVIIGISTAAFAIEYSSLVNINSLSKFILPIVIIAINLFALLYAWKSRKFVKMHQARAKKAREIVSPYLNEINEAVGKIESSKDLLNRTRLQQYVHAVMIIVALLSIFV